jgi:coenzyme F420-reducing hydrogenase alpha subunit
MTQSTKNLKVKARPKSRTLKVDYLARVEGETSLQIRTRDGKVDSVQLKIFEPPRLFEALLRGRMFEEVPDLTSRICGICPVAYQLSSIHAMENAFEIRVTPAIRDLRRLMLCGEWIESHGLHVHMLHAPDFMGCIDAFEMARDDKEVIQRGLKLKKTGNEIMSLLGGREIHPINMRVGGFYRLPSNKDLRAILDSLRWAQDASIETVRWVAGFPFPELQRKYEFVSLSHPEEYPMIEGRLKSNKGLDIEIDEYDSNFTEHQVEYSHALHSTVNGRGEYLTGPMARYNLNYKKLSALTRQVAESVGISEQCLNPYKSIIIRSLEILYACDEAIRLIERYEPTGPASVEVPVRESVGFGCIEAPRGFLYHQYRVASDGMIQAAKIVPPTSQNQKTIESDVAAVAMQAIHLPERELTFRCEQAIRNHDPCISCAAHFLRLKRDS